MDPRGTSGFRAAIVARSRFIDDLVAEQADRGVTQYLVLGAGLDTLAQRRPEITARLRVFEVDQPGTQAWKRRRLIELGYGIPDWLRLVPVDFEAGEDWWKQLSEAGFDPGRPTVRRLHGRHHVPHQRRHRGHPAPPRRARPRLDPRHDVHLPTELIDDADRPALEATKPQGASSRNALHQLLYPAGNAGAGPRRRLRRRPARTGNPARRALLR